MSTFRYLYMFVSAFLWCSFSYAQDSALPLAKNANYNLTVSYKIEMKSRKGAGGIREAYNGGTKTIFVSNGVVRLRQLSLMRMQSIFILPPGNPQRAVAMVKESGKEKYKMYLTKGEWKQYNRKYENATCKLMEETMVIAGYICRKAVITLSDGKNITVFYTPQLPYMETAKAEPAFACIPGLVLKYEYKYKKSSIIYTAVAINNKPIDQNILKTPSVGYAIKEYTPQSH